MASCESLPKGLSSCRSREITSRSTVAKSSRGVSVSLFIPATRSARLSLITKSAPCFLNASTGPVAVLLKARPSGSAPVFPGQVRVLLGAGEGELALDDRLVEDKPRVLMARFHDVFERPNVSNPG